MEPLTVYCDGCAEPNPGSQGIGVVFKQADITIATIAEYIGQGTNNIAEYRAVVTALKYAVMQGWQIQAVYTDSNLVINQVTGNWRINKSEFSRLSDEIKNLCKQVGNPRILWVRSEDNPADAPSRQAIVGIEPPQRLGRLHIVSKTRKQFICRECGRPILPGSSCYRQNVYKSEDTYHGEQTRLCTECGEKFMECGVVQ